MWVDGRACGLLFRIIVLSTTGYHSQLYRPTGVKELERGSLWAWVAQGMEGRERLSYGEAGLHQETTYLKPPQW